MARPSRTRPAEEPRALDGSDRDLSTDRRLEETIRDLLSRRAPTSTICPSDAARAVGDDGWRDLMEPARQAAQRLVESGEVVITQKGEVVDLATAHGPIRIRAQAARTGAKPPRPHAR